MNCPSRTDEPVAADGYNQNPNALSNDLTTNQDLIGLANSRELRRADPPPIESAGQCADQDSGAGLDTPGPVRLGSPLSNGQSLFGQTSRAPSRASRSPSVHAAGSNGSGRRTPSSVLSRVKHSVLTFGKFVGPGFMIAVAYIDPGNYATDIAAGATYRFRLLFVVLLSNIFAIFLQSLSIKLGTVSGLNLAEACRAFLPRWLNYFLYFLAEVAIIATDIAEVIGTAIALNLLIPKLPLVAGCAISIVDVMIILIFYRPSGSMRGLRAFEVFVMLLVLAVVVCFCVELSIIKDTSVSEVFQGYLPSSAVVQQQGLYQACGILGATVMPHSLYLGSGIVQSRLRDYDTKRGLLPTRPSSMTSSIHEDFEKGIYVPSMAAIKHSLKYSITELTVSLFTFALFVNSAILIVAGASLYQNPDALDADIFGIHDLLSISLSPAAGTIFALALLLSGVSAGIVCTIAGQIVSEGALNWTLKPWLRRLITRSISITPSIIIAGAVGRKGLDAALNGSQVVLSIVLPFVTAPLIWFTCRNKYMTVLPGNARFRGSPVSTVNDEEGTTPGGSSSVKMGNSWLVAGLAVVVWVIIAAMNVANLVLLGKGH